MTRVVSLFTDLDRTLLPNGAEAESPHARELLASLVRRGLVELTFVSGRSLPLVMRAISEYALPEPVAIVGNVGTSIHERCRGGWQACEEWNELILRDFGGHTTDDLEEALRGLPGLRVQESERQTPAKLSYYAPEDVDPQALRDIIDSRLRSLGVRVRIVVSVDEAAGVGLVDLLPASASKWHAIEFLISRRGSSRTRAIFAGDSGNDLEVLASPLRSILVANARPDVREAAMAQSEAAGNAETLFIAHGGYLGLNGNYCGGILEGLAWAFPDLDAAMRDEMPVGEGDDSR